MTAETLVNGGHRPPLQKIPWGRLKGNFIGIPPSLRARLRRGKRLSLDDIIWSIGVVDSIEIDQINILRATHKAMRFALDGLSGPPDHVLIDGLPVSPFPLPQTAIIDGDCISLSIAAASVIAKVTRDRLMREFCARFPEYCFSQHKGYGTELHLIKLHEHGACPIHRRSFEPVAQPLLALELVMSNDNAAGSDQDVSNFSRSRLEIENLASSTASATLQPPLRSE